MKEKLEESVRIILESFRFTKFVAQSAISQATQFIADLTARLGEGVDPPPEMEVLREARDADGDENTLALRIFELMIGE